MLSLAQARIAAPRAELSRLQQEVVFSDAWRSVDLLGVQAASLRAGAALPMPSSRSKRKRETARSAG
jgi:hypothetical protein